MIRSGLWALLVLGVLLLAQTTVLNFFNLAGIKPGLVLIVFVILASQNGGLVSQVVGFILGLGIDIITTAPLGYNAFLYSLAGYLFGLGKGKVYFDPLVVPAVMGVLATLYAALGGFLLSYFFQLGNPWESYFQFSLLIELAINLVAAPLVFLVYNVLRQRFQDPRRGFDG